MCLIDDVAGADPTNCPTIGTALFEEVPGPWPGSPEQYWTYRCETGARFPQYLASLPLAAQASVRKEVIASIGEYYDGQQVNFSAVIVIASGVR